MWKRIISLIILAVMLLTITGCWDRWELEDLAYVISMGIDLVPNSTDRIVTINVALPTKLAGGGQGSGGDGKTFFTYSARARDWFVGFDMLQSVVSRRLSMLQCRAIFVGERYAKEMGVLPMTRITARYPELRRDVVLVCVKGEAQKLMKSDTAVLEKNIVRYYDEIFMGSTFTGFLTTSSFQEFMKGMESYGHNSIVVAAALNSGDMEEPKPNAKAGEVPRTGGRPTDYIGVAVFKGDKLQDFLGKQETEVTNMLRGDWRGGALEFPDPEQPEFLLGGNMTVVQKPNVQVDLTAEPITIDVSVKCTFHLMSEVGQTDYTKTENRLKLDQEIKSILEQRAREIINRAQNEFTADIFKFGTNGALKKFRTWQEWEAFNWPEKFPTAQIHVTFEPNTEWFGLQGAQPNIIQ